MISKALYGRNGSSGFAKTLLEGVELNFNVSGTEQTETIANAFLKICERYRPYGREPDYFKPQKSVENENMI